MVGFGVLSLSLGRGDECVDRGEKGLNLRDLNLDLDLSAIEGVLLRRDDSESFFVCPEVWLVA